MGRGEGTFLKKSFLLPSPHPSPHLPKTFVTGIRRGVVCRAGPDEETLMSAGAHELSAGDCCAASFPPELLSCSLPPSKFLLEGVQGRALFSKSALPRTPSLKNFDWWGGCAAGVPFAGKRKRTFFRNFFRVLSVLFNGALLGKGFQIFIFPEARKAPGISPGAFLVS